MTDPDIIERWRAFKPDYPSLDLGRSEQYDRSAVWVKWFFGRLRKTTIVLPDRMIHQVWGFPSVVRCAHECRHGDGSPPKLYHLDESWDDPCGHKLVAASLAHRTEQGLLSRLDEAERRNAAMKKTVRKLRTENETLRKAIRKAVRGPLLPRVRESHA